MKIKYLIYSTDYIIYIIILYISGTKIFTYNIFYDSKKISLLTNQCGLELQKKTGVHREGQSVEWDGLECTYSSISFDRDGVMGRE